MPKVFDFPDGPFSATVEPPGDKSLSHRALILAGLAPGSSQIANLAPGADIASTVRVLDALGIRRHDERVDSEGVESWMTPSGALDCGNSGTTMRVMTGALAGSPARATLVGDDSLMRRPMQRLVEPLSILGARIQVAAGGVPPVTVAGGPLHGADVQLPVASAQVRTAVEIAALHAEGETSVDSPPGFRDHTERWLAALGRGRYESATRFVVEPGELSPLDLQIPGDPSSAAFLWACAAVREGSRITTPGVSLNPGRLGFLDVLSAMGCAVTVQESASVLGDPVGTVTVSTHSLVGTTIAGELATRAIDELPLVAVVAAVAHGRTEVRGAAELALKESDRIEASVRLARLLGSEAEATDDGFSITPSGREMPNDAVIEARGDHRIAMAGAVAGAAAATSVTVSGFGASEVSWPGFAEVVESLWS